MSSIPRVVVPNYTTTLPSNGKTVTYRPYLVKEKKLLMLAKEQGSNEAIVAAIKQVITNCTLGTVDAEKIGILDLQYLFLKIRSKSVGEVVEFLIPCQSCKMKVETQINLDAIEVSKNPKHTNKIMLDDNIGITMKYPDINSDKILRSGNSNTTKEMDFIVNAIDTVFDKNQIYYAKDYSEAELKELVDSMTESNYQKIAEFYQTMPRLTHKVEYKCPRCGVDGTAEFNNIYDFFA